MPTWDWAEIERAFAEAAVEPTLWVEALRKVVTTTSSYGALLIPIRGASLPTIPFTEKMEGSLEDYIRQGWHLRDERHRGISKMLKFGVVDDLDIHSPEVIAKHPYYQDFLAPHDLRWFAGVKVACGDDLWCLSIQRTISQGPFSALEKAQLAGLSARVSTSAAIARALGGSAASGLLDAFEISSTPVALVDRHENVFKLNRTAEKLLVEDIQIKRGKLVGSDERATAKLELAIRALLRSPVAGMSPPIVLPRKGRRPIIAYPSRLPSMVSNALADCQALIIFVDFESVPRPPPTAELRSVLGLSEAEARLSVHLAAGQPLEAAAERLGIAKETSRSQLKSVFAKLGINRQAELIAVLAKLLNSR